MAEAAEMKLAVQVFYCYAHEDEKLRDKLERQLALLKRQRIIAGWSDRSISAGREWAEEIGKYLNSAGIILLLVSDAFLSSDFINDVELKRAMERHETGEAVVIPVILRSCDWESAVFGKLQALPKHGKAVTTWSNRDEAFTDIARGIRKVAEGLQG